MTPNVFTCGVDLFGMSNLTTTYYSTPPYWISLVASFKVMVGADPTTDEGAF